MTSQNLIMSCTVYWRKKHCVLYQHFHRGVTWIQKTRCGDQEQWITLCEIKSINTINIDGYIKKYYTFVKEHLHLLVSRAKVLRVVEVVCYSMPHKM